MEKAVEEVTLHERLEVTLQHVLHVVWVRDAGDDTSPGDVHAPHGPDLQARRYAGSERRWRRTNDVTVCDVKLGQAGRHILTCLVTRVAQSYRV